jgi:hypothetical protein
MTIRIPVSSLQNRWNDAQRVDRSDLDTEQDHNNSAVAAVVNNHMGSGVLPASALQNVLFDSDDLTSDQASILAAGDFDGTGFQVAAQPSDSNLGNQIEVELTGTTAFGRLSTKVLIVGLDFQNVPQYDRFTFHRDEKQVTRKHYRHILGVFFNDFKGNNNCSRNLGGRIVIREAASFQLSRDPIMVSQDVEPNLFFRDFKVPNPSVTLYNTLQQGIGSEYSVDSLDINTTVKQNRSLAAGDVTSKIAEKFLATSNNIQKVTLLLGVTANAGAPSATLFDWTGNIVISVYELQTTVNCPTDYKPDLAIEFDPSSQPLAQLSYSQAELRDLGYVLTDVLQPVDFVFSETQLGSTSNSIVVPGRYYAVTINRAGAASNGEIFTGVGNDKTDNARLTLYSGVWVDVAEEDLWFQIWSDDAKVADGQAYDAGNGIQLAKTTINDLGAEIDYALVDQPLADSGENTLNTAVIEAVVQESVREQDERTGNPVNSRKEFVPSFSFVTSAGLSALKAVGEPLIIGCAEDTNPKLNELLEKVQIWPGLAKGDTFTVVNPDPDLLSNNLLGSKLIPDVGCNVRDYRIFKVLYCVDGYGDVNGDGYIDSLDVARCSELVGESLLLDSTQQKIVDGYISTLEMLRADVDGDGYISATDVSLISQFVNRTINSFSVGATFTHLDIIVQQSIGRNDGYYDCDGYVRLDGYSGKNIVSPDTLDPYQLIYDGYSQDVHIEVADSTFTTVPFPGVTFQVVAQPFWQDYLLAFSSDARQVPASFTYPTSTGAASCEQMQSLFGCSDRSVITPECDPGRNDIMFPDNIILRGGQILNPDGTNHRIDFEIGQVIVELPEVPLEESVLNIFDKFVADAGDGFTRAGFPAMRFADCSTVQSDALAKRQVKFGVAVQAFVPNLDGYDDDGYGVIVDDIIGVYMDHSTGILTLTVKDLAVDDIFKTLVTKIEITVYLKKGGWVNGVLVVGPSQVPGLLSSG